MPTYRKGQIAFLSTFPPRECGLATFTEQLTSEIDKSGILAKSKIVSLSTKPYNYDNRVIFDIQQDDLDSYLEAANIIKNSGIDLLCIEHEYGIFGGYYGEFLVDFIQKIDLPIVTTLHTVLPEPNSRQLYIMSKIGQKSNRIVTMSKITIDTLVKTYGIDREKINFIPHGVPFRIMPSREKLKSKYSLKGKKVVSTFGLISPGKGLEIGIEAISKIVKENPDLVYLILGQTHPVVKKQMGEVYRESLKSMVNTLGIEKNIIFVDKYLEINELLEYLKLSDIYMTPYLGKDQAVSGTLAYAAGYGKAIVSTPYIYAQELLADGRGLLADFKSSTSLADCLSSILSDPQLQFELEQRTKEYGQYMMWKNVTASYAKMFTEVIGSGNVFEKNA